MTDVLQIGEPGPSRLLPLTKGRHLRGGDEWSGRRVEALRSLREPLDKPSASRLARRSRCEEDLLQHRVSLEGRVTEVSGQTGFLQVHDVFAAARRGPDKNHAA